MSALMSLPAIPFETIDLAGKLEKVKHGLKSDNLSRPAENTPGLKEACSELESLFVAYLLKEMRATIPKTGLISGGRAEEIYTAMLDTQISKEMVSQRGIGFSSLIFDRLESRSGDAAGKNVKKNNPKD